MEKTYSVLSKTKIFQGLSPTMVRDIFDSCRLNIKTYLKGEIFISEDDVLNSIAIVLEGSFSITKTYVDGNQALLQQAGPSYAIGVDVLFTRSRISPYSAQAMEESRIFLLPGDLLQKESRLPDSTRLLILENMLTIISHENMRKYNTLELLAKKSLRDKVMTYLLRQKKKYNSTTFTIPLNREQLADYLCVNRSALSHELSVMQKEGLIRYSKNTFTILDI